ncbi:MAG: hypothetical protein IT305_05540 [Chloroflexi bacterium]|nr:hypothetical protein [Chloroflexota bacterium]
MYSCVYRLVSIFVVTLLVAQSSVQVSLAGDQPGPTDDVIDSSDPPACPRPLSVEPTAWHVEGNDALNDMRAAATRALAAVEVHQPGVTGELVGFRAGAHYAHIYARDSATIAPAAQYLYDLPYLTRPTEEFLALQYDGDPGDPEDALWKTPGQPGATSATIGGPEIAPAKMLVTSDEEPSLITMAYVAFKAGAGVTWLLDKQAGAPRIERLNAAMDWLYSRRYDEQLRLIKRGNTTDWGDVAVGVGPTSGSITKAPDEWTASIYDQAWTYRALVQLAEMNRAVDRPDLAEKQLGRARVLRQSSAERLWQPDRGYFRTRLFVPPAVRTLDEDSIVSIANGVAVYSGITDETERGPIFKALETARIQAKAPKPGLSLWPAYPLGYFDYPQMVPGRYQNGAVWDWWAGMQISAEFWNGYSTLGRQHLAMVADDWARSAGEIYEWQEQGTGRNAGSPDYSGAAATMTEAIVTGLFGVNLDTAGWEASPRLGAQSGGVHVYQPPTGCWLDYWHTYAGDRVAVEWDTNHSKTGAVRVLLPPNTVVDRALFDQKPVQLKTEVVGEDSFAVLAVPAPPGKHRLELRLKDSAG